MRGQAESLGSVCLSCCNIGDPMIAQSTLHRCIEGVDCPGSDQIMKVLVAQILHIFHVLKFPAWPGRLKSYLLIKLKGSQIKPQSAVTVVRPHLELCTHHPCLRKMNSGWNRHEEGPMGWSRGWRANECVAWRCSLLVGALSWQGFQFNKARFLRASSSPCPMTLDCAVAQLQQKGWRLPSWDNCIACELGQMWIWLSLGWEGPRTEVSLFLGNCSNHEVGGNHSIPATG